MKKLIALAIGLIVSAQLTPSAFARVQTEDPTCTHSCTAAEKTAGTCKDYRREDGTCFQVRGSGAVATPAPTAVPTTPPTTGGTATRINITILNESDASINFRGIASNGRARVNGATVQCRRGSQTNKRNWGRVRTTNDRGIFTVGGPKDSSAPCYQCVSGNVRSNTVCLN